MMNLTVEELNSAKMSREELSREQSKLEALKISGNQFELRDGRRESSKHGSNVEDRKIRAVDS